MPALYEKIAARNVERLAALSVAQIGGRDGDGIAACRDRSRHRITPF
jgi:hypothetical protein